MLQRFYNRPFEKIRPEWLINPKTGRALELDLYNESLKLAVEYDGRQHKQYVKFFHKTRKNFKRQKERDTIKSRICKDLGITLIRVPWHIKYDDLEAYLKLELVKAGKLTVEFGENIIKGLQAS